MRINPRKGLQVLSEQGVFLERTRKGTEVPTSTYYRRLLKAGDIEELPTKTTKKSPQTKTPELGEIKE